MKLINAEELNRLKLHGNSDFIKGWNMALDAAMDVQEVKPEEHHDAFEMAYNNGYTAGYAKGSNNYEN